MYQLNFDGCTLYDPRIEELTIRDVAVHLAVDEAGRLSFVIDHDHPYVDRLTKIKGRVELLADGNPIYRGRIVSVLSNFDLSLSVETEGQLACLNDSIVLPYSFPVDYEHDPEYEAAENVVAFWLDALLKQHNSQVSKEQQIKLGEVTVKDPNNYISRSDTNYTTTWDTIKSKLLSSTLGGHLLVRYEKDGTYLDYLADYKLSNVQEVAFSENLIDLTDQIDAVDVYTAILPVGAEGLTVETLPDGDLTEDLVKTGRIVWSREGVERYGKITAMCAWDDVTEVQNLCEKAKKMLAHTGLLPLQTITATAVDLHCADQEVAALRVGRYTRVVSAPHGLDLRYAITSLDPDIQSPGNTRVTLGAAVKTSSQMAHNQNSQMQQDISGMHEQVESAVDTANGIAKETSNQITSALKDSQEIIFAAMKDYTLTTDMEAFKHTVASQFKIMAEKIELRFTEATEHIQNVNGDLQGKYDQISKYFRFTADGMVIGQEGNEITLKLNNDRISFLDGGLEVAWITNKKLTITDATFLNSLRIGKFAWIPRRNGNLSLVKVGD